MDIDTFYTAQASQPAVQKTGGGKDAPVEVQGLGFIDFILTRLIETAKDKLQKDATDDATAKTGEEKDSFNMAQLLAANEDVKDEVKAFQHTKIFDGDAQTEILQTLALNQKAFDDTLSPLTDGAITAEEAQKGSPRLLHALLIDGEKDRKGLLDKLSLILNKLQKLAESKDGAGFALTNLTPEQITNLKAKIASLLAKTDGGEKSCAQVAIETGETPPAVGTDETADKKDEDAEDAEIAGILLGLIKILPPQAQPEIIVMPQSLIITPRPLDVKSAIPQAGKLKAANDLASSLNALIVGGDGTEETTSAPTSPLIAKPGEEDFGALLKQFSGKKGGAELALAQIDVKAAAQNIPSVKPDLSALQNWLFSESGSLFATADDWQRYFNGLGQTPGLNLTGPGNFTNLVTQAPSAGAAHPAVQIVAATIQKAAGDGTDRNIILQLDPPELGRVEVRLNFGKDKTVKAVVLAENKDAVAMLQRDGHVLEKALQNAGIDADGSSLSFELAAEGHFSGHDGGGGNSNGHSGNAGGDDETIIESNMTWFVDPASGHMRYDILA